MYTISDILKDVDRGCMVNNLNEDCFSYRIVFFVNGRNKSTKHYIDTGYYGLRKSLEIIIRENLSLTNSVTIAAITVLKNRKCIFLQSRSYSFNLDEYFRYLNGEYRDSNNRYGNTMYRKRGRDCARVYGKVESTYRDNKYRCSGIR